MSRLRRVTAIRGYRLSLSPTPSGGAAVREQVAMAGNQIMEEALKVISAYQQAWGGVQSLLGTTAHAGPEVRGGAQVLHEEACRTA